MSVVRKKDKINVLGDGRSWRAKNASGKFASIHLRVPSFHQAIVTCFCTSRNFWPDSLRCEQETTDVVQEWLKVAVTLIGNMRTTVGPAI